MKYFLIFLLLIPVASACQDYYNNDAAVIIQDAIADPSGIGASCNITTYYNSTVVNSGWMNRLFLAYNYSLGLLTEGQYESIIFCNATSGTNFTGSCRFKVIDVEPDDDLVIVKSNQAVMDSRLQYINVTTLKINDTLMYVNTTVSNIRNDTNWTVWFFQAESSVLGFWQKLLNILTGGQAW